MLHKISFIFNITCLQSKHFSFNVNIFLHHSFQISPGHNTHLLSINRFLQTNHKSGCRWNICCWCRLLYLWQLYISPTSVQHGLSWSWSQTSGLNLWHVPSWQLCVMLLVKWGARVLMGGKRSALHGAEGMVPATSCRRKLRWKTDGSIIWQHPQFFMHFPKGLALEPMAQSTSLWWELAACSTTVSPQIPLSWAVGNYTAALGPGAL